MNSQIVTKDHLQQVIDVVSDNAKSTNDLNKLFGQTLQDLINKINSKFILVSYSTDGFVVFDNLLEMFSKNHWFSNKKW